MHYCAKFCANRSNHCRDMAVFVFFKMAAVRHLGFSKVSNFNSPHPSGGQNASPCQILCRSVMALQRYGRFRFFFKQKTAYEIGVRLVGSEMCIRDRFRQNLARRHSSTLLSVPTVKNLNFPKSNMAAVRHFGFSKVGIFNCRYLSESQNASSCQISVQPFRRYGRFSIFKMAVVRHLGFVLRVSGPPTKSTWWSLL